MLCELKQGGPVSSYLFIIAVPFLAALSLVSGVGCMSGFCYGLAAIMQGTLLVRSKVRLISEFESVSCQRIDRDKSLWIVNREMSAWERRVISECWLDVNIVRARKFLGTAFGHGVQEDDLVRDCYACFESQIRELQALRMSFGM